MIRRWITRWLIGDLHEAMRTAMVTHRKRTGNPFV